MLGGKLLEQVEDGILHTTGELVGDLAHDGLDVVPGEIVLGERIDLAVIVLLHGRGHFFCELRAAQEVAPIFGA